MIYGVQWDATYKNQATSGFVFTDNLGEVIEQIKKATSTWNLSRDNVYDGIKFEVVVMTVIDNNNK